MSWLPCHLSILIITLGLSNCVSTATNTASGNLEVVYLKASESSNHLIDKPSSLSSELSVPKYFEFGPGILFIANIVRPRATIRSGPGHQYPILDQVLDSGSLIVVFEQFGAWRKILSPINQIQGWVHAAVLGKISFNNQVIRLEGVLLPTITLVRKVRKVYEHPSLQSRDVGWRRGRMFVLLAENSKRKLIWLHGQNQMVWIDKGDAE